MARLFSLSCSRASLSSKCEAALHHYQRDLVGTRTRSHNQSFERIDLLPNLLPTESRPHSSPHHVAGLNRTADEDGRCSCGAMAVAIGPKCVPVAALVVGGCLLAAIAGLCVLVVRRQLPGDDGDGDSEEEHALRSGVLEVRRRMRIRRRDGFCLSTERMPRMGRATVISALQVFLFLQHSRFCLIVQIFAPQLLLGDRYVTDIILVGISVPFNLKARRTQVEAAAKLSLVRPDCDAGLVDGFFHTLQAS